MINLPRETDIRDFRKFLDAYGYKETELNARIGTASPPNTSNRQRLAYVTREATPQNALVRLFLLGHSIDQATITDVLPESFLELCTRAELLEQAGDRIRATVVIVAIADLLIASDAYHVLGSDRAGEFVLPASTHSAGFLRKLTLRDSFATMLDLGCGSGIHALFAARHCDKVTAADISATAIAYTAFNARLNNIDNIECVEGSFFEPVAGRSFDLIVSNPPFVLGPDDAFVYRDSQLELDQTCRELVADAPAFLNENGYLQMLCETVEIENEPWLERMKSWFEGTGCDAWILHSPTLHPVHYVANRASNVTGGSLEESTGYDAWVDYFESRSVSAIHPILITARRRDANNWTHVHNLPGDIDGEAGEAVRKSIAACDFLERCASDAALLDASLKISPDLTLEQQFSRQEQQWQPQLSTMRMTNGLPMDAEVDLPILAFLNQLDGQQTLQGTVEAFAKAVGADTAKLVADLLPIVRMFVGRGFLEPVT